MSGQSGTSFPSSGQPGLGVLLRAPSSDVRGPRVRKPPPPCRTTALVPIVPLTMQTGPPTSTRLIPQRYAGHMTRNVRRSFPGVGVLRPLVDRQRNSSPCLTFFPPVPGLSEGVPGANRARAGRQPPAGPAGHGRPSRKQGQGAAGPVQHPHRRTRRQPMNSHRCTELVTVCR